MPYIIQSNVQAYINAGQLMACLDDDRDGAEDDGLWDSIVDACSADVDGRLASTYAVPFTTVPAKVKAAVTIFVCEALYARRLTPDDSNPFKKRADDWRKVLDAIGNGDAALDLSATEAFTPGAAITAPIVFATSSI